MGVSPSQSLVRLLVLESCPNGPDEATAILLLVWVCLTASCGKEAEAAVGRGAGKPGLQARLLQLPAVTWASHLGLPWIPVSHVTGETAL